MADSFLSTIRDLISLPLWRRIKGGPATRIRGRVDSISTFHPRISPADPRLQRPHLILLTQLAAPLISYTDLVPRIGRLVKGSEGKLQFYCPLQTPGVCPTIPEVSCRIRLQEKPVVQLPATEAPTIMISFPLVHAFVCFFLFPSVIFVCCVRSSSCLCFSGCLYLL